MAMTDIPALPLIGLAQAVVLVLDEESTTGKSECAFLFLLSLCLGVDQLLR